MPRSDEMATRRPCRRWFFLTAEIYIVNFCPCRAILAYADDVNILGGSIHTLKENAEALVSCY